MLAVGCTCSISCRLCRSTTCRRPIKLQPLSSAFPTPLQPRHRHHYRTHIAMEQEMLQNLDDAHLHGLSQFPPRCLPSLPSPRPAQVLRQIELHSSRLVSSVLRVRVCSGLRALIQRAACDHRTPSFPFNAQIMRGTASGVYLRHLLPLSPSGTVPPRKIMTPKAHCSWSLILRGRVALCRRSVGGTI